MLNHYHAVLQIDEALSQGMCELNGRFAVRSNRRNGRRDHLFGRRFTSHLIEDDAYLLESIRYVVLNPVRAGRVQNPERWHWSSMRATLGLERPPACLDLEFVLGLFGSTPRTARRNFRDFVAAGLGAPLPVPGTDQER
jgi:putative transposase